MHCTASKSVLHTVWCQHVLYTLHVVSESVFDTLSVLVQVLDSLRASAARLVPEEWGDREPLKVVETLQELANAAVVRDALSAAEVTESARDCSFYSISSGMQTAHPWLYHF